MIKRRESEALKKLKEDRSRRKLEELNSGFSRTLGHLDEIGKLGDEAFKRRSATIEATRTKASIKTAPVTRLPEPAKIKPVRKKKR